MPIDIDRARAETPGTRYVAHLNNAGSALPTQSVVDTVVDHLQREATVGGYEASAAAGPAIDAGYEAVGALIGARPHEIAFVESATQAWNAAFTALTLHPGQRIITGRSEYPSNAMGLLIAAERHGIEIVLIDDDEHGQIDLGALRAEIDERAALIAITHVATSGGLVNPAEEIGAIARDAGVLFLLDACQSIGQLSIDVDAIGCDMLSATGRKFLRGPRGTGFLFVRESIVDQLRPSAADARGATWTSESSYRYADGARRFEMFEHSVAARLGLCQAVEEANAWGIDAIEARTGALAADLRRRLTAVDGVQVHDKGTRRCGIVTFSVDRVAAADVHAALAAARVNTSITQAMYAQFDFPRRGLDQLVRASPHYYNNEAELDALVEVVAAVAPR